jgi:hypothetical protein
VFAENAFGRNEKAFTGLNAIANLGRHRAAGLLFVQGTLRREGSQLGVLRDPAQWWGSRQTRLILIKARVDRQPHIGVRFQQRRVAMSRSRDSCCGVGEEATLESPALESKERFGGGEIEKSNLEDKCKNIFDLLSTKCLALSKDDNCWLAFS